jgi:hypothetical protein
MAMNWTPRALVSVPLARLVLIAGGGLLALSTLVLTIGHRCHQRATPVMFELSLAVAQEEPNCFYGSRFDSEAGVLLDHDGSDGSRVEFQQRYPAPDGCWWESSEVLTPMSSDLYRYSYTERLTSCPNGQESQYRACIRTGQVWVTPLVD